MVAQYILKSYRLNDFEKSMLLGLHDPRKQHATLTVYSQTYRAQEFAVGGLRDKVTRLLNRGTKLVNFVTGLLGGRAIESRPTLDGAIMHFIEGLRRDRYRATASEAA